MGQDEIYLQVIQSSGEGSERAHASKVLNLIKKGKHWVLVTLLLSNVITNETLPIVLDRSLGGGWPAILSSTVLIGVFFITAIVLQCRLISGFSYFWRNCTTVDMRSLWTTNWCLDGTFCTDTDVADGPSSMARC